jgi:hypothetical protein
MITEGLVREIYHISNYFNTQVKLSVEYLGKKIDIEVYSRYVKLFYKGEKIWQECIDEEIGNFGIESVQHIFLIIEKIEKGEEWRNLAFSEDEEDLNKIYKEGALKAKKELLESITRDDSQNNNNRTEE